jgi:N-methylhydantoinase B/oxoprolinase/acetone carboxylase alpha subunit
VVEGFDGTSGANRYDEFAPTDPEVLEFPVPGAAGELARSEEDQGSAGKWKGGMAVAAACASSNP